MHQGILQQSVPRKREPAKNLPPRHPRETDSHGPLFHNDREAWRGYNTSQEGVLPLSQPSLAPYTSSASDASFQFFGVPTALHATGESTGGAYMLTESWDMPPGFASPYHVHRAEDEAFYILEGEIAFVIDGKWLVAKAGAYVFGPRNIPHGFKVVGSQPARMLLWCTPSGFEHFVRELSEPAGTPPAPPDMGVLMAAAAKRQLEILGPLPEGPDLPS